MDFGIILIVVVLAGSVETIPFETMAACEVAKAEIQDYRILTACVDQKGSENAA